METITLYLGIGLLFEFIVNHLGRWASPTFHPFGFIEKIIVMVLWPLALLIFIYFFMLELFKLRK